MLKQRSKNKGTWSIVIELDRDAATGKRHQKWVTFQGSHTEAQKKLTELLHQLDTGSCIQLGKTTVAEYLERWLAEYARPNLSPRTADGYSKIVRHDVIPHLGAIALVSLKPEHLQKFYAQELERGLSAQTVRNHHTMMHKALQTAIEWGLLARNVADAAKPPMQTTPRNVYLE